MAPEALDGTLARPFTHSTTAAKPEQDLPFARFMMGAAGKTKGGRVHSPSERPLPSFIQFANSSLLPKTQRLRFRFFLSACVAAVAACAIGACHSAPRLTDQEAEGKHLYSIRCAHCHEDNDLALKKIPPNLRSVFQREKLPSGAPASDGQVRQVVLAGKGMMPSFAGRFTDQQMSALLAYLHTGLR